MFAESLLESGKVPHKGRGWATTLSIVLQSCLVALLAAMPMLRPDALPLQLRSVTAPIALGAPEPLPASPRPPGGRTASELRPTFHEPRQIPAGPPTTDLRPPTEDSGPPCIHDCSVLPRTSITGISGGLELLTTGPTTVKPPRPSAPPRVSQMALGAVIHQVRPVYPPIAQQIRLEGSVILRALIGRDGRVTSVQVLSGHALFHDSAKTAVSQWRYRPYVLNGEAVEVETHITVNYVLAR